MKATTTASGCLTGLTTGHRNYPKVKAGRTKTQRVWSAPERLSLSFESVSSFRGNEELLDRFVFKQLRAENRSHVSWN